MYKNGDASRDKPTFDYGQIKTMDEPTDKKIVCKSLPMTIFLVILSWGLLIIAILSHYTPGIILSAIMAVVTTFPLVDPHKKIIYYDSKEYNEYLKQQEQERTKEFFTRVNDLGIFSYSDNGFIVKFTQRSFDIKWTEIQSLFGYKKDLMTTDEICLDVFCDNDAAFSINEETPGWYEFLNKLSEKFPQINRGWDVKVAQPPFATNLTLIYDRDGRTFEQTKNIQYKDK